MCGETGSGKTEFIKYLASKIKENEKIITIEDTLELHLDRIFPHRDIVAMKTNNIASYSEVLVTCMRQNPKWILLSEVRSAEAVLAVRNSISSGHYILSTIHADKAESIPTRMYSLLETNQDIEQFLKTIYRYIQLGIYVRAYLDKDTKKFVREIAEVTEFYVTPDNKAESNIIYKKFSDGKVVRNEPSKYLRDYLLVQGVVLPEHVFTGLPRTDDTNMNVQGATTNNAYIANNTINSTVPINNNISTNNYNIPANNISSMNTIPNNINSMNNIPTNVNSVNNDVEVLF